MGINIKLSKIVAVFPIIFVTYCRSGKSKADKNEQHSKLIQIITLKFNEL